MSVFQLRVDRDGYENWFMKQKRKKAYRAGVRAEWIASVYLMAKGYRILDRRYKTPVGEIDLVVSRKSRIAFVEVKGRGKEVEALYAVSAHQQRRIKRAASHWLTKKANSSLDETGFDVVAIVPWKIPRHYKDAFSHTTY